MVLVGVPQMLRFNFIKSAAVSEASLDFCFKKLLSKELGFWNRSYRINFLHVTVTLTLSLILTSVNKFTNYFEHPTVLIHRF